MSDQKVINVKELPEPIALVRFECPDCNNLLAEMIVQVRAVVMCDSCGGIWYSDFDPAIGKVEIFRVEDNIVVIDCSGRDKPIHANRFRGQWFMGLGQNE